METHPPTRTSNPLSGKRIGILGGTGPAAAAHVHALVVRAAQELFGAAEDQDFPEIVVLSSPLPGTDASGWPPEREQEVADALASQLRRLGDLGCQVILPACNSIGQLAAAPAGSLLISLPESGLREAARLGFGKLGFGKLGLLASEASLRRKIFSVGEHPLELILPRASEQAQLTQLIGEVMSGLPRGERPMWPRAPRLTPRGPGRLADLAMSLGARGAGAVMIGCTEISAINPGTVLAAPGGPVWIDSARLGAEEAVRALAALPLPGTREVAACA